MGETVRPPCLASLTQLQAMQTALIETICATSGDMLTFAGWKMCLGSKIIPTKAFLHGEAVALK